MQLHGHIHTVHVKSTVRLAVDQVAVLDLNEEMWSSLLVVKLISNVSAHIQKEKKNVVSL